MRSRDIVGKRVKAIGQERIQDANGSWFANLYEIEFEGGSFLRFVVAELEGEYGVEPIFVKAPRKGGKRDGTGKGKGKGKEDPKTEGRG